MMSKYNTIGALTCALMLVLDLLWLSLMKTRYNRWISAVQFSPLTIRKWSAIVAYMFMCVAVFYILLPLTLYAYNPFTGAIVGGCIYGIYNATNYAVLKNYSLTMAIVDTIWGMVLFSILSGFIFLYR